MLISHKLRDIFQLLLTLNPELGMGLTLSQASYMTLNKSRSLSKHQFLHFSTIASVVLKLGCT